MDFCFQTMDFGHDDPGHHDPAQLQPVHEEPAQEGLDPTVFMEDPVGGLDILNSTLNFDAADFFGNYVPDFSLEENEETTKRNNSSEGKSKKKEKSDETKLMVGGGGSGSQTVGGDDGPGGLEGFVAGEVQSAGHVHNGGVAVGYGQGGGAVAKGRGKDMSRLLAMHEESLVTLEDPGSDPEITGSFVPGQVRGGQQGRGADGRGDGGRGGRARGAVGQGGRQFSEFLAGPHPSGPKKEGIWGLAGSQARLNPHAAPHSLASCPPTGMSSAPVHGLLSSGPPSLSFGPSHSLASAPSHSLSSAPTSRPSYKLAAAVPDHVHPPISFGPESHTGARLGGPIGRAGLLRTRSVPAMQSKFYQENPRSFVDVSCQAVTVVNK